MLEKFALVSAAPQSYQYTLHSVLVHSGTVSGGHYYAYIQPKWDGNLFKFNNSVVCPAWAAEAIEANFGSSGRGRTEPSG
jgi:ubiquitin carboxyl-terminal hydrolase 7